MKCRYCSVDEKMSGEHIIPSFIYKFVNDSGLPNLGWNQRAKNIISAEFKVADVCKGCNNGPLSDLDAYGQKFLTSNGFLTQLFLKTTTDIYYDYNLLLRWLMKISYNAAAACNDPHASVFNDYREFILTGSPAPHQNEVMLFIGLTSPLKLSEKLEENTNIVVSDDNLCAPFYVRITENIPDFLSRNIIMRGLYFGSIFLHIAILKNPKISKSFFKREACNKANIKYIAPNTSGSTITTCGKNWVELSEVATDIQYKTLGYDYIDKKVNSLKIPKKKI